MALTALAKSEEVVGNLLVSIDRAGQFLPISVSKTVKRKSRRPGWPLSLWLPLDFFVFDLQQKDLL